MGNSVVERLRVRKNCTAFIIISILTLVVYSNSFYSPFVFDDLPNIVDNSNVKITKFGWEQINQVVQSPSVNNRPVAYLSFSINYLLSGTNVFGYHIINFLIHLITGFLVYGISFLTFTHLFTRSQRISNIALLSALLWISHPIQVQSVTYIVQRMNSLATMFVVAAMFLYAYLRIYEKGGYKRYLFLIGIVVCWLLGAGSKETAYILPILIILYEAVILKNKIRCSFLILVIAFVIVAFIFYYLDIFTFFYQLISRYEFRDFTLNERLMTELRVVVFYLSLLALPLPSRLNLQHDFSISHSLFDPITTILAFLLLFSLLIIGLFCVKKYRLLSFSIFWFFSTLLIESTFIPLELIFEHRLYLPSIGVFMLCGYLIFVPRAYIKISYILLVGIISINSLWTIQRNSVWQTRLSLAYDSMQKSPNLPRANGAYAQALFEVGDYKQSIEYLEKTIELDPKNIDAHVLLGLANKEIGKVDLAERAFIKALEIAPGHKRAYNNLGLLYLNQGEFSKAEEFLVKATMIDHNYVQAWFNLGLLYYNLDDFENAENCLLRALALAPGNKMILDTIIAILLEHNECSRLEKLRSKYPKMFRSYNWVNSKQENRCFSEINNQ